MTSLAAIHTGKKALGLDDDTYRAMLTRVTGKRSAKDLTNTERFLVVEEMRRQGFKPSSRGTQKPLEGKYAKKLQALWIAAWNLGLIRDKSDKALIAFVKRQTSIDHIRFLRDADDASKAIEALKSWLTRMGGVDWKNFAGMENFQKAAGCRIAMAQWSILHCNNADKLKKFTQEITAMTGKSVQMMADADWIVVMNSFGRKIRRELRKEGASNGRL